MAEEDKEIELLKLRKIRELERKLKTQSAKEPESTRHPDPDPWAILKSRLVDRGDEVLEAARAQYPEYTEKVVQELAKLIASGRLHGTISGGVLLSIFRELGLPVRLKTRIMIEDHGRLISISDKLRSKD